MIGAKFNFIKSLYKIFIKEIFDLIYKKKCINCNCSIQEGILCKSCSKTVQNLSPFAHSIINGYKVYSAFYYEGVIKNLIHELKFKHNRKCAKLGAIYLFSYLNKIKEYEKSDIDYKDAIIIPVVTHKKNYNKRGYDNVVEIGYKLKELIGCKINENVLHKVKYTTPQYKLNAKTRKNNPVGSFELNSDFYTDKLIILLDDIITTGSTLDFITSLFKRNGIKNLICLTLSKTKKF